MISSSFSLRSDGDLTFGGADLNQKQEADLLPSSLIKLCYLSVHLPSQEEYRDILLEPEHLEECIWSMTEIKIVYFLGKHLIFFSLFPNYVISRFNYLSTSAKMDFSPSGDWGYKPNMGK